MGEQDDQSAHQKRAEHIDDQRTKYLALGKTIPKEFNGRYGYAIAGYRTECAACRDGSYCAYHKTPYILMTMFTHLSDRYKAILLGALGYGVFVLSDTAVKTITPFYSIYQIIAGTFVIAGVLFMLLSPWLGGVKSLRDPRNAHLHLIRGVANFFGASLVVYFFSILPLTSVYTVMFLSPFIMVMIAIPLYGEKVGLYRWISMVIGFAGVLVAFRPWENDMPLWQFGLLLAAPLAFSVMHSMMRGMKDPTPLTMGFYPMFIAFWPMSAMALFVEGYVPFAPEHLIYLVISAVCITAGFVSLSKAFHMADSSLVSPLQYSQMLWGVIIGFFMFGDMPDMWMMAGSALIILSGIYLIHRERAVLGVAEDEPHGDRF